MLNLPMSDYTARLNPMVKIRVEVQRIHTKHFDDNECNPSSAIVLPLAVDVFETQEATPWAILRKLHKQMGQIAIRVCRSLREMLLDWISPDGTKT